MPFVFSKISVEEFENIAEKIKNKDIYVLLIAGKA
jgi:hypothetical protein